MKKPIIYSTNPQALKKADPAGLNEAQRNYRDMLLRQDAERMAVRYGDSYVLEIADRINQQRIACSPQRDTADSKEKPAVKDAFSAN